MYFLLFCPPSFYLKIFILNVCVLIMILPFITSMFPIDMMLGDNLCNHFQHQCHDLHVDA